MLNNPQQRKALVLSLLMVMLAQTAYIEVYRGWKPAVELQEEETDVLRVGSPAVCSAASRTSGTEIHVDVAEGDDTYPGTTNCPKASLGAAVTLAASESASNPEIVLHAGLYHENVSVNNLDNLLIRAATGERVVFDGTRSITDDLGGVWGSADSDGIQEVTLTEDGWQLFLDHEEQVPARWPNAGFDDETVFNRSYWAEGTLTNSNNAYTIGWLTDAGPEAGVHTGLNETVNATGLDPVGAIAVMNLGSFRSNSRIITDWNPNNGTFAYDGTGVGWKTKHHAYFLEGKRELIDQDGEWWFNNTNNRLHYKAPSGQDANDLDLRVKVQPFAISVDGSDGVTIQGIDFFGTTVNFNNCDSCSFTNATLEYPSTSKRGLGIAGESEDDRWMTRFYRSKNSFVDRISITNTDGGAIEFQGSPGQSHNNTVNNSYFHAIDWSAADQKGLMVTIYEGGRDMYFTNNTVHLTGASSVLSIGDAPKVFYNEVWDVGHLQTDGAVVQVMQGEAPGAEIAYNWIHDVIKYGARFDAPIGEVGEGRNGTMHHNVIWNAAGGLMVKGDYHDIHNNTVFNSTGKNDIIFLTDGGINNKNSTLHYNAVDAMADHRSDDIFANPIPYGADWMNWNGYIQGKQDAVTTLHDEISNNVRYGNTCIINSTKSLLCWGYNANGRLGLGNTTDQSSPVAVTFPNGGTVEKLAESGGFVSHNCAIMTNGSLYCWGKNSGGQLGIGSTTQQTTPQLVNLGSGVKAVDVSVGQAFTCAVTDAGALMCWGDNSYGKLGIGSAGSSYSTPQNASLPTNRKAVDVQLGRHFGYALLDNGDVVSWGRNHVGYLGIGNTTTMYSPTVVSLDSQRQVVSISGGKQHGCIGYDNGSVVCTGRDNYGQQGTNSASESNDLTFSYTNALANLSVFALAGQYTSCALLANGTAQCWGAGGNGQMGDGTTGNNHYPDDLVNTPSGRFIVDMSMSGSHACIVLDDGSVACWGLNNKGQLGLGNTTQQNQPVLLTGLDDLSTTSVHEMLVDPANNDFRPKWGSHLHVLNAGAYDADDSNPWTAGISWNYTAPDAPVAGCMLDYADNYDADATLSDGSCLFASYTPPSTLDLRLHLDPTNSSSYSGSGTNVADLSGFDNNGTIAAAGPTWDADFTRFTYDGACTGSSGNYVCDEIEIEDSTNLRPGEPYEDLAVNLSQGFSTQSLKAPSTTAGYTLGAINTSFTVQVWLYPTDCETATDYQTFLHKEESYSFACKKGFFHYRLGNGTGWPDAWVNTSVNAVDDVWQHVAFTRSGISNPVNMYLDGVLSFTASTSVDEIGEDNQEPLVVGTNPGDSSGAQRFYGILDDVRIYTSDRSSTIDVDMNEYPNVTDNYLNAYFDFNLERDGDTITSVPNMATGSGASSASLTVVSGSPEVVRTWDVSTVGSDTVLTFERTVLTAQGGWRVPTGVSSADVLIVGGGGGGGYNTGGGGGGGGVGFYNSTALTAGSSVVVVVGQGGQGSTTNTANGANGQASQLGTSVVGGGGGGAGWGSSGANGSDAPTGSPAFDKNGSGGGASNTGGGGGTGATNGGDGANDAGAGGGGAGQDGSNAPSTNNGGDGGDGLNSSITGSLVMYGSGAGGGSWNSYGDGGAGAGAGGTSTAATHGTTNRGGGGGGGGGNSKEGANGGSGVVIVRYASVDHNDWSVATWINASSLQGSTIIGTYDDDGLSSDIGWALRIRSATGDLYATVGTTTNSSAAWTSDASINTDRWYHVVMVADVGNTLRLYLDGVNVANGSLSGSGNIRDVSNNVFLGSYNGGEEDQPFDGQIGSVMAFADALNASNINQLYTSGKGVYSNTTNLSYAQSSSTLILGQTYSFPLTVANGEVTTSYSLSGTLPSGMNFESSNGTIWGTPTVTMTSTTYTVTANNSAGSYTTSISLTSQHVAPYDLVYSPENMTLTKGTAMTTNTPSVSGGTVTSWAISPSLPSGLAFSTSTGAISGTPTVLQTIATTYTVWANNSGGSASAQVNITINDEAPNSLSYSPKNMTLTKGTTMTPNLPSVSGGAITSWEISPSLPSGLTWGTADGKISGTPTVLQTTTVAYTVWANNSGGSVSVQVNITINDQVPNALGYTPENMTLEKGTTMTTNTPSVSGGAVTSWDIDPSLPSGLSFGSTNGSIWGTPSVLQTSATTYTIWANNSGGSTSAQVNITINDQIASISYSSPVEMSNNRPLSSTITPTTSGGAITSWEITPALPTGLTFGTSNGSIWGTPENVTSNATYTIYANNSGGSASATLTLNMNWTLTPSVDGAYITRNSSIGTDITWEWDYDPLEAIYAGLVTGEWNTCAIDDNGDVFCWGRNGNGQIGNGQSASIACGTNGHKCKDIPTRTIDLGSDVVALAFGHQHACGLTDAGVVKCWGRNNNGQIGTSGGDVDTPFTVSLGSGRTATSIYAGGYSTCAILDDGSTKCWGHNSDGQLGIGSTSNTNTPTTINSLGSGRTAVSLAMAMTTVCALLDDGSVKCWGDDSQKQLGNGGTNADINSPPSSAINLGSGRTAKSITAGEYHFCAILDDDSITCWGDGLNGKLGTGSTSDRSTPAAVSGSFASGRYAVYLDAGYDHTCAILDNGDLTCWGSDNKGQLGNGAGSSSDVSSLSSSVISLGFGRTAISVSAGGQHTCAQLDNGQLKCWGNRGDGQVGDNGGFNSPSDRTSPSTVSNNNYGGNTYADTGVFPSAAVTGATCAISPALPTGMSLTSGTCAITGTPTVTAVNATYTVWANISGQSFSGQVWLEVGLNVPILSYSPTSYLFVNGTAIAEVQPINTGGEISGFDISPALPNGLSIGSTNGTIWGTPTVASALTSYTIWGNNSAGSSSTTISIKVETTPTSLSYDTENMTLTKGLAMTTNTATVGGGTPTSWEISPALPSGLSFSSTTGDISGTPTVLQTSAVTYTVWANNTAGSVNTSLNITINDVAPNSVVYSPENMSFTNNSAITTNTPTASGGPVTSWAISPALPNGLSFGTTNGSIWGTPTLEQASTTYTVWANNSGGSSSGTINITVGPAAPGDFEYIPEDNVLINTTYAHLAPSFVNITTGNGTTWQVGSSDTYPGSNFAFNINGTVYFNAGSNEKLWAYSPGNNSSWKVNNTVTWVGEHMAYAVEDTLYFSGHKAATGREFYAYTTTNETLWLVSDIRSGSQNSNPGQNQGSPAQDGDVLFFKAYEDYRMWWSYNHSNGTLTKLNQVWSHSGNFSEVIGDILYMRGTVGNGHAEVWAYSAVNATAWMIEDIYSGSASSGSEAGEYLHTVVNDILLFDAWSGVTNDPRSIWAYNPANATAWELQSADSTLGDDHVTTSSTVCGQPLVVGDVAYFCATGGPGAGGYELWAYNTSNETTWLVTDIAPSGDSHPGKHMFEFLGDTLYFSAADGSTGIEMWAYDTSNHTTWRVADINSGSFHSNPGQYMTVVFGDTLYFSAKTEATNQELFAYDTSNQSLWLVEDIRAGSQSSFVGEKMALVAGNKLMFNAKPSGTTSYLYGHEPSEINWMTNTGGNVTTWAINNTNLPTGLTFSTSNGTVYGTPTQLWSKTAYMVWANNSGGSSVGYLNITVLDANLSYSKYDLTLTKDQASNDLPLNATTTASGTVTTWAISSTLPAGLNFGTSNGTIWGIPTVLQTTASTYTIWANGTHGSVSAIITLTIYDNAPGPFEYNPENNTLTNNTYVHLAPQFINQTTGNGSTWQVADIDSGTDSSAPGWQMQILVDDTLYFSANDGSSGHELWAHDTSNASTWQVADIRSGSGDSIPGQHMEILVGDTLYFSANGGSGIELWAHDTSNASTWQVADIHSTGSSIPGQYMGILVGDTLYFSANDGSSGIELWAHDTSNASTWQVADIYSGASGSNPGQYMEILVGDTLYFSANDGSSGIELWAHDTSNSSTWQVADIDSGTGSSAPGSQMSILVGDTLYFRAKDGSSGYELWAHDTSNASTWRVADINSGAGHSNLGQLMEILVGDTLYFDATDGSSGYELWAHDTSNASTWRVADINSGAGHSYPGQYMQILVGDTLYFEATDGSSGRELWAHDTSNASTWQVADIRSGSGSSTPGTYMEILVGDTLYFGANDGSSGTELWAHDTSNASTWRVADIQSGGGNSIPGLYMEMLVGDTLYFSADDGSSGYELWAHRPSTIGYNTNTGGAVTSWAINASLPSGLTFSTTNGSIYGTPTELWTQTSYMVWANNTGGSSVAYLNITVVDELPTLSYSPENLTLTKGQSSTDLPLNATLTGSGTITSWAISPALPSGLTFGTSNGTIWGIPTVLQTTATTYTVWANNSGGSVNATVNITVNDEAPDISYNPDWFVLTNNTAMSPTATPTNSGGAIPSGIIDQPSQVGSWSGEGRSNSMAVDSNGVAHVVYFGGYQYDSLYYATNANGSWVATMMATASQFYESNGASIVIDANDTIHISYSYKKQSGSLIYSTCSSSCSSASSWSSTPVGSGGYNNNIAIDTNGTLHISHSTSSSLGASLQHSTCSSSCTTSSWTTTSILTSSTIVISSISMTTDSNNSIHMLYREGYGNPTFDLNYATCSSGCTSASSWSIVEIDTSTTTTFLSRQSIAVDSNNGIHITYGLNGNLTYATCSSSCTSASSWTNTTVDTATPFGKGEIALDSNDHLYISYGKGSSFGASKLAYATCSSSCTSSSSWTNTTFDTKGGTDRDLVLDSNDRVHISYHTSSTDKSLRYLAIEPSSIVYAYSISPPLPAGLSLEISTGKISGTPTELSANTTYTITVRNSGGVNTTTITIEVIDQVPTVAYSPADLTLTNNTVSSDLPLLPTITGSGEITSWELNASLPSGLTFEISNGTIWGTPTELWTQTSYMVWANNTGGSSVAYLNITVVDEVPTLSYSPSTLVLTNNTASSDLPLSPTLTGSGEITSWELNASLPSGLTFETSNGTIWGTPTELWNTTAYTVWANNTGGSSVAYLNITVVDELPTVAYSPSTLVLTNNTVSSDLPLLPTLTGSGEITSWELNASLPSGLTFETSNGTIWGTPTELWNTTAYTVWANNSGGSSVAYLNITVVDELPTIAYSPSTLVLTNNTASGDLPLSPTITGSGEITSWAINASLPSGLTFETSNGTIWGTPTELWTQTSYMVWANNTGGSSVAYLNITVVDELPTIAYSPSTLVLTNNTASSDLPLLPTITGSGEITSWDINASLPSGLTFETSNGTIWGTSTELWNTTAYTVWANNSGGSSVAYLNITVVDELPTLSYSPSTLVLTNNTASSDLPLSPTLTGSGEITSWELNASLPSGLSFGTTNGTIYGTPTELWYQTAYMVWGNNSGGSSVAYLNITVVDQLPTVAYSPANVILTNNTASSDLPLVPIVTGQGEITLWGLNTSLPSGLSFDNNNGTIWGTPTELWPTTAYRLAALNSGGTTYAYFNITVNDQLPTSVTYTPENLTLTRGEVSTDLPLIPAITGPGDITSWVINASLPTGLSFGTNNGTIWGVPQVNMTTTAYTVWANNTGGSVSTTINITVLEPVVVLDYNPENLTLIRGVQMATLSPSVSGGNVSEWAISPVLPAGLNFSGGVISGTPTVNMTLTLFTVYANTSGGSTYHTLNITILEPSGNLSYSPENITLTRGVAMSDLHPTYNGGSIENWSIHPALPAGLNFSNGVISGTPTVNMTTSMFTVYANNSGGSAAATINITILEPVVDLLYSPDNLTLMRGTTMQPLHPTVSGGNVSEWALVGVLPEGLNFSNGVFSGTPLVNMTQTQYLVYANTSGGSATAWVNITVLEPAVDLSYNPYNITLIRNDTMNPLSPTVSGGNVSNWSIVPELPAGLNFTNGTISGTPEVNMTTTMFTVWANTSGGASSTTVNITILEPVVDFIYNPNSLVLTRNESMNATSPVFGNDALAEEWGISPALPEGLNFTNGTISGTPVVNMTATVFTIYANNSAGSAAAFLTITILEPVATVVYVPENITLTRGEDNASIVPILGGGMAASWSISPALPEGLVFDNGTITGVPLVNSTNTTYTVMALNSGGMAFAFLNITVLEPVAILAFNESFVVTRGEDLLNHSVNNTGGMVATWEIEPALPAGVAFVNGLLYGVPSVNMSETTFTVWGNNSGGTANLTFTLEVLEPLVILNYPLQNESFITGVTRVLIVPEVEGGVPETWAIEPALPEGLAFVNGYIVGFPTVSMEATTFTVWANNSGGSSTAEISFTVDKPTFFARYPVTRIVLDVNETLEPVSPIYYFRDEQQVSWSIGPALPAGLMFDNGTLSGTPIEPSNLTNYTVMATGEMVPVEFYVLIEVRAEKNNTVETIRNESTVDQFVLPVIDDEDDTFDMYYLCFPLLLFVVLLGVAGINSFLALAAKDEDEEEEPENENKDDAEDAG